MKSKAVLKYLAEIGAKGGSQRTPAQTKARQLNGKKGGRPKTKALPPG